MKRIRFYANKFFVAAVIVLLLIFLYFIGVLAPVQNIMVKAIQPISSAVFKVSVLSDKAASGVDLSKGDLSLENQKLKEEINELIVQKAELESLRDENDSLKKIINFTEGNEHEFCVAKIIATDPDKDLEAVVINKGRKDGIRKNQIVLSEEGVAVGKIYKVHDQYSSVLFLTDNHIKLAVSVLNKERTNGLLEGRLGLVSWVNFIPQDADLSPGDIVITNGTEENIPRGLVIGQIEEIFEKPDQLFKSAKIKQNTPYNQLNLLNIIIQGHD